MPGFAPESYDTIVPRTFRMKRVEIDPRTLETENKPQVNVERKQESVLLEKEQPQVEKTKDDEGMPNLLPKPMEKIPLEKPDAQMTASGLESILRKTDTEQIPIVENEKRIRADGFQLPDAMSGEKEKGGGIASDKKGMHQFSSLDDLLANTGAVKKNTAPILMPTDLLFEYNSDTLKPEATETLSKLGTLIKKNAQAAFRIEGHTDSFGSDEYNMQLSLRRAEAVKTWLKNTMGLDEARISTVGLGKSRLLVPATGTVGEQQINRRVEIVIYSPR